jgi:2-polyprenyl-6-methoxyphenol hydroxylase-like FAD-dependent oxidoreductase
VDHAKILVIGGGIGGLTAAIASRRRGFDVEVIERDPDWSVYGVGIIQQSNVVRAMAQLGVLEDYLDAAFGFDFVEIHLPDGRRAARVPSPKLVEGQPANLGVSRPALHKVLGDTALALGAKVRRGVTATRFQENDEDVLVEFSDGNHDRFDLVIGADGVYSETRAKLFPGAPRPEFTGQAVWRYNLPRPADLDCLRAYDGRKGIGLVPLSSSMMYLYVTTPEPGNPWFDRRGLAGEMRARLSDAPPAIRDLSDQITDDDAVVYRPLECLFLEGSWSKGRIALLGDAVHACTPHLGQGAGMAIEDAIVLAEEIARAETPQLAFEAYRQRRFERCAYIVKASREICDAQLGKIPPPEYARATSEMFEVTARPI